MMDARLQQLRMRLAESDLSAMLVTKAENIYYLSGFSGSAGALLITHDSACLFSDCRYRLQAAAETPNWPFHLVERSLQEAVSAYLPTLGAARVAFEAAAMTVEDYRLFCVDGADAPYSLCPTTGLIEELRMVKDVSEIAAIRDAARITDAACAHVMAMAHPGVTEQELALEAEWHMRRHGAEGVAFAIIIAAGTQSALPHAQPGARPLAAGDLVVVDMGARAARYCADMTRTFAVGHADSQARQIYRVCAQAQQAGVDGIHAGMSGIEADALVRAVIAGAGFAEYFGHGTGHGTGLEIHEAPRASPSYAGIIPAGATLTIEPGIYLPEFGGVRIEDLVVVHDHGTEVITGAPKPLELPVVG